MMFLKRGARKERTALELEKPEPFTEKQKITLAIIGISLVLIIVPVVLKTFIDTPFIAKLSGFVNIITVWTVGIIVQTLLNLGDLKEIISKKVPWGSIILVCGMSTLFNLASTLGVVDILGGVVSNVSPILVLPFIATICAILSFFVSGLVITPFFAALATTFAAASGYPIVLVMAAIIAGGGATSISPVSAGGAYLLSAAPNENVLSECRGGLAKVAVANVFVEFAVWFLIALIAA